MATPNELVDTTALIILNIQPLGGHEDIQSQSMINGLMIKFIMILKNAKTSAT